MPKSKPAMSDFVGGLGAVANMRFGPGVVGRIGSVLMVFIVAMGAIGLVLAVTRPDLLLHLIYLVAAIVVLFVVGSFVYAHVQPQAAALDSAHWAKVLTHDVMRAGPGGETVELVNVTPPTENPRRLEGGPPEGGDA
jgi:hypothetical protein